MKDNSLAKKRNIALRYDISFSLAAAGIPTSPVTQKKLRRLPHVFCRVLELPFSSNVPVAVEETHECFRFVVSTDVGFEEVGPVGVQVIEIFPGVTKVVVGGGANRLRISLDEAELGLWRFRLPSSTLPELSRAIYSDGELLVIIPKDVSNNFPAEEDNGTLIGATQEDLDLGVGNENPGGITRPDCNSENPTEEGSGRGKFEGQVLYDRGARLNNEIGGLALMKPGISVGSRVTVQL